MNLFSSLEKKQSLGDFVEKAYLTYSMDVILDRALPHISDGLKPVQRRIIYAMSEIGLNSSSKYKKSARTVGDVLGKYHPHGDSSCYEAMVLMAQDFSYRYPLIDGQGNWGSIDDTKSFAAMRYTESRLSKYSILLLDELQKGNIDWIKNFDGTLYEPKFLSSQIPNILLNGAIGIAVGMSTYIPPHNITEIINACSYLLSNSNSSITDILEIIKAPDYPGGANIISTKEEIAQMYKLGKGSIRQQGVYHYDIDGNIVITKLPHQVSSSSVMLQIANQLQKNKITWIRNIQDESDDKESIKIVLYSVTTKKNIKKLMDHLFATTDLEKKFRINMNIIGLDNKPKVKNLLEILTEWIGYRRQTLRRKLKTSLDKVIMRLHILEGILIAFLNIDKVIDIVRNYDDPSINLQNRFSLSKIQSEEILNIRLRKLVRIEEDEINKEQKDLFREKQCLEAYLNNDVYFSNLMQEEFKKILKDFGDTRRSKIIQRPPSQKLKDNDLIMLEKVTVILSTAGWIRCAKGDNVDPKNLNYKPEDKPFLTVSGYSNIKLIFFTKIGKCYSMYINKLPSARGYGEHITKYISLDKKDKIINMEFINVASNFLIASSSGKGFIIDADDLISNKVTGKKIFYGNDVLVFIPFYKNFKMIGVSCNGRIIIRDFNNFVLLKKGNGKSIIELDKEDRLNFVDLFSLEQHVILYAGKRFINIDNKKIDLYMTDKVLDRGTLLPQGFRKVTKIEIRR